MKLLLLGAAGLGLWLVLGRRRADERRVVVAWDDGSELELREGTEERERLVAIAAAGSAMTAVDELGRRLLDAALLEGDFTLRSGKRSRWYLDKYRFETDPSLLRELGERLAARRPGTAEPDAVRLAGPALGAVALAASAAMASGVPFIIVRDEAKGYGTGNRLEGPLRAR